uniref:Uncharacterized protein n=1 Tax=Clytia hemisphaerica TaxID=252671 RepID=A0A7M6DLQ9_9CNID
MTLAKYFIVWFITVSLIITQSLSFEFTGETSHQIFPSSLNQVIFRVSTSLGESNNAVRYFIHNVNKDGEAPPDRSLWGALSDQTDADDCSALAETFYPTPRKYFCIDHRTGDVKLTSSYSVSAALEKYHIDIKVSDGTDTKHQTYEISYWPSECQYIQAQYDSIQANSNCYHSRSKTYKFNIDFDDTSVYTAITLDEPGFLVDISYNRSKLSVNDFSTLNITYVGDDGFVTEKIFTDEKFPNPVPLIAGQTLFRMAIKDTTTGQNLLAHSKGWRMYVILGTNFCSANATCIDSTGHWLNEQERLNEYCVVDSYGYLHKYGYCTENPTRFSNTIATTSSPTTTTTTTTEGPTISATSSDPCQNYILDNDPENWKRSTGNIISSNTTDKYCDRQGWQQGWRRFVSGAGTMIPTQCPPAFACGTDYPMWLNGAHPTTINAEATIPLCLRVSATQCCQNVGTINVKKCAADTSGVGDFFVYNLPAAPGCHMAYCYGSEMPCPNGQTSSTGFTPCSSPSIDDQLSSFNGIQYYFSTARANWQSAENDCVDLGGHLTSVHSQAENNFLKQEFHNRTGRRIAWYGGEKRNGVFIWSDGTSFTKTFWKSGEPNNLNGNENCLLTNDGAWNDEDCSVTKYYVCKLDSEFTLRFLTKPSVRKSESGNEVIISGCSYSSSTHSSWMAKSFIQRNNDDLIAIFNATQVTDETKDENVFTLPSVKLSNVEGGDFSCVVVIDNMTFFSNTTKFIPENQVTSFNEAQYYFSISKKNWQSAENDCIYLGGHLTSVHSQAENEFINQEIKRTTGNVIVWYGGERKNNVFVWTDGTIFTKTFWNTGEPNNLGGNENCLNVYATGMWNDISCHNLFYYVCKLRSSDFTLQFLTKPSLRRSESRKETIVSGCSYSSSTHSSWMAKSFIQRNNDDLIAISTAVQVTNETSRDNVFTLPSVKLSYIEHGDFRCVIIHDSITYYSFASKLYKSPDFIDVPTFARESQHLLSGCNFLYHEAPQTDNVFFNLYNNAKQLTNRRRTTIKNSTIPNQYHFNQVTVTNYTDVGNYIRCQIDIETNTTMSNFSDIINVHYPSVIDHPTSNSTIYFVGDPIQIGGCAFKSTFRQGVQGYWLKNGDVYNENVNLVYEIATDGLIVLKLPDLIIDKAIESANYSCQLDAIVNGDGDIRITHSNPVQALVYDPYATFNGVRYYFSITKKDWQSAENDCVDLGGHLTSVHSQAENDFLHQQLLNRTGSGDAWYGGLRSENVFFLWSDGSGFLTTFWNPGEPNDSGGAEDCLQGWAANDHWNDAWCGKKFHFVCKIYSDFTLQFLTKPSLRRSESRKETIVSGCSYSSSTHSSWTAKSFIQRNNDDLIAISTAVQVTNETSRDNVFTLPSVKLPYIEHGDFRCVIIVADKTYYSNSSKLYKSAEFTNVPTFESGTQHLLSGCHFLYHEAPQTDNVFFNLYNDAKQLTNRRRTTIKNSTIPNQYHFNQVTVTNYTDVGNYIRCQIDIETNTTMSNFSDIINVHYPSVLNQPTSNFTNYFIGDPIQVGSCAFKSMFDQGVQGYWLKNGAVYTENVTLVYEIATDGLLVLKLPDLIIDEASESANYSCQLDVIVNGDGGIRTARSNAVQTTVFSNGVRFLTKPTIKRTSNETIISGCTYTSSRNISFLTFSFIEYKGTAFDISSATTKGEVRIGDVITLPEYRFNYAINNGTLSCGIIVGKEYFTSNTSKVYLEPVFLTTPFTTNLGQTGVKLDGCDFKFHQSFPGKASFLVYDANKNLLNEMPTTFSASTTSDIYTFDSVTINSYDSTGTYFRCQLSPNENAFEDEVVGDYSMQTNITAPRFTQRPTFEKSSYFVGENIRIDGCEFTARFLNNVNVTLWKGADRVSTYTEADMTIVWQDDLFKVVVKDQMIEARLNSSGVYHCQMDYMAGQTPSTIRSDTSVLNVKSNNVVFQTRPTSKRTTDEILVSGCTYMSSRNQNLVEFSFIEYSYTGVANSILQEITSLTNETGAVTISNGFFSLPPVSINKSYGDARINCVIKIGEETFSSNTSNIYSSPSFETVPNVSTFNKSGLTISGCKYFFHQKVEVSIVVMDENKDILVEIDTQSNHLAGDSLTMDPIIIDSYENAGFYYKCKAVDPSRPTEHAFSDSSTVFNLTYPYFTKPLSFDRDFYFIGERTAANPCRFKSMFIKGLNFSSLHLETGLSNKLPLSNSWQNDSFYNITYPKAEFEAAMFYHGNYTCRVDYMVGNRTLTSESDVSIFVVKSNDVQFLSRPSLERTSSNVIIKNCTYTSARNQDLAQYASIRINNDTFGIDVTTSVGLLGVAVQGGRYTLPDLAVPRMDSADVSCVFDIGEETFVSRVSRLYTQPEFVGHPIVTPLVNVGIKISGCTFKFHQLFDGKVNIRSLDDTETKIISIPSNLTKLSDDDLYGIDPVVVDSYVDAGNYYRCKLKDLTIDNQSTSSSASSRLDVTVPEFLSGPITREDAYFEGDPIRLQGCRFQSMFNKGFTMHLMKDSKVEKSLTTRVESWTIGNFTITSDIGEIESLTNSTGNYSCRLTVQMATAMDTEPRFIDIESNATSIIVKENQLHFTSHPDIHRTLNQTLVYGCNYTSERNESLTQYGYIEFNGTLYKIDAQTNETGDRFGNIYQLPVYKFDGRLSEGHFYCVFMIDDTIVRSKRSFLYNTPEFITRPFSTGPTPKGVEILGCSFKYHQLLQGDAFFSILDSNMNAISRIPTTIVKSKERDVYVFNSTLVNSYNNLGEYIRCDLINPTYMLQPAVSQISNQTNTSLPSFVHQLNFTSRPHFIGDKIQFGSCQFTSIFTEDLQLSYIYNHQVLTNISMEDAMVQWMDDQDHFLIQTPMLEMEIFRNSSGNYSCRLQVIIANGSVFHQVESQNYSLVALSNNVNFTSTPMVQRIADQRLAVIGCNYVSPRNRSLAEYIKIIINGTEPTPPPMVTTHEIWDQVLPIHVYSYYIGTGDVQCVAQFGEERFLSGKSTLYVEPEILTSPTYKEFNEDGITVEGCTFKYHQPLSQTSYLVLDQNKNIVREIPVNVSQSGVDTYFTDPLIVDNYENLGVYYQCRLSYFGETDSLFKVSDLSVAAPYTLPSKGNCPKELGFCVTQNGADQNSGVIQLDALGGNSEERHQECLEKCLAYPGKTTGCELIWTQFNQGCYVHTQFVDRGNGLNFHNCWVFSKCKSSPSFTRTFYSPPVYIGDKMNTTGCQYKTLFTRGIQFYEVKNEMEYNIIENKSMDMTWHDDHYLVTYVLDNNSTILTKELRANFSCVVKYVHLNKTETTISEVAFHDVRSNDVRFMTKPTLYRTHNETIVKGCQFTTANVESAVSNGFIRYNQTAHYVGSTLSFENEKGLLSFPEWKFPYRINSGDFWCVVRVGFPVVLEEFVSNSSMLYKEPEFLDEPELERLSFEGVEISGCRFKYHQEPSTGFLVILDDDRTPMARINTTFSRLGSGGNDVYEMTSIVIVSYDVMGSYFYCEINDGAKRTISNISAEIEVALPSFISGPSAAEESYFTGSAFTMDGCSFNTTFIKGFTLTTITPNGRQVVELKDQMFVWTGDIFEVQLDQIEYGNITTNVSGLYSCRIDGMHNNKTFRIESESYRVHIEESDVYFTSKPIIHTTLTTTNINGCTYKSARNESLLQHSYIAVNGTLLQKVNALTISSGESSINDRFYFPNTTLPYKLQQSDVTCVIVLGTNRYESNATMVYNHPEFITVPKALNPKQEGVEIIGCSIKYHQLLQGDAFFSILDSNMNAISRVPTTIVKSKERDVYEFAPAMMETYKDLGSFIRCSLFDSKDVMEPVISQRSNKTHFTLPTFVNGPITKQTSLFVGDEVIIEGCNFTTLFTGDLRMSLHHNNRFISNVSTDDFKWNVDSFLVQPDESELRMRTNSSGNYTCRIEFLFESQTRSVESPVLNLKVYGNNATFTSTPKLERSSTNTTIGGCQYTSNQGTDLIKHAYIKFNGTLYSYPEDSSSGLSGDSEFMLPALIFQYYIEEGFFGCVIKIEDETFESEAAELYEKPEFSVLPNQKSTIERGIKLRGCRFKYHQLLRSSDANVSFEIYDSKSVLLKSLPSYVVENTDLKDGYLFHLSYLTTYDVLGGFAKCKISMRDEDIFSDRSQTFSFSAPSILQQHVPTQPSFYIGETITIQNCQFNSTLDKDIEIYYLKDDTVIQTARFNSTWMNGTFTIDVEDFVAQANNTADSGAYRCRLQSISNSSLYVESGPATITVKSNDVAFQSRPVIQRTLQQTFVSRCQYSSAGNRNLTQYLFTKSEKGLVRATNHSSMFDGSEPGTIFNEPITDGDFSCVIKIGDETFESNSSKLYAEIEFQSIPTTTLNTRNGITITGCQFKYHQVSSSKDVYSFTIYDQNNTFIKEIPTTITPSTRAENDTYTFDSITVNSYEDLGTFIRCHVFDPLEMKVSNLSKASLAVNVKLPSAMVHPNSTSQTYHTGQNISITHCMFSSMFTENITISLVKDGSPLIQNVAFRFSWSISIGSYSLTTEDFLLVNVDSENSGRYWCVLRYNQTMKVRTKQLPIFVNQFDVEIKNRPSLTRTLSNTTISGCVYVSFLNESLMQYLYIRRDETLIKVSEDVSTLPSNQIFTFPSLTINENISTGNFSCVIQTVRETITSNYSLLYESPGNI